MLVNGWTFMGQRRSSYVYTMGFGVSAPTVDFTTRKAVAYSHSFPNKIILNCHPLSEERARLGVYELVIIKHRRCLTQTLKSSSGMTGLLSGMTIKDWLEGGCYDK